MYIEPEYQKVYNSQWFQEQFIDENGGDPSLYLTRLLNFNLNSIATDHDTIHYDTLLKCPNVVFSMINNVVNIDVDPFNFIMDSTYFEFTESSNLTIDYSNVNEPIYPLSIILVIKYKYEHTNIDQKAELKCFLYDSLKGIILDGIWETDTHYLFLDIRNVFHTENGYDFVKFSQLPLPPCVTEGTTSGSCDENVEEIDFTHMHFFEHSHEHYQQHTHENIVVPFAELGGLTIESSSTYYILNEDLLPITNELGQKIVYNTSTYLCQFILKNDNQEPLLDVYGNTITMTIDYNELLLKLRQDTNGYYIEDDRDNRYYLLNPIEDILIVDYNIPFVNDENQIPNCNEFINYSALPNGVIVINNVQYKYDYDYCYYIQYIRYFVYLMSDSLLQYYVRNIKVPLPIDYLYGNLRSYYGAIN